MKFISAFAVVAVNAKCDFDMETPFAHFGDLDGVSNTWSNGKRQISYTGST